MEIRKQSFTNNLFFACIFLKKIVLLYYLFVHLIIYTS